MFKEPEPGRKDINVERTEEALSTGAKIIAVACPFCMTMVRDGIKSESREEELKNLDVVEVLARACGVDEPGGGSANDQSEAAVA